MATVSWTICCQRALVDQTNNLTLVQILEELGIPLPPAEHPIQEGAIVPFQFFIVSMWYRSKPDTAENARGRIRLLTPKGKEIGKGEFDVNLTAHVRGRGVFELPGLPYHGTGAYEICTDLLLPSGKWKNLSNSQILVHHNVVTVEARPPAADLAVPPKKRKRAARRNTR